MIKEYSDKEKFLERTLEEARKLGFSEININVEIMGWSYTVKKGRNEDDNKM